jgi:hypothetical protein
MPQVLRTNEDGEAVDILGVGVLAAGGRGGIPVAEAAKHMPELQERTATGAVAKDDDGNPKPLKGSALTAAAQRLAEDRGWVVENVKEDKLEGLRAELPGYTPSRPSLEELSAAESARYQVVPVNDDPELLLEGSDATGAPSPPAELDDDQQRLTGTGKYHPNFTAPGADDREGGATPEGGSATSAAQGSVAAGAGTAAASSTTGGGGS